MMLPGKASFDLFWQIRPFFRKLKDTSREQKKLSIPQTNGEIFVSFVLPRFLYNTDIRDLIVEANLYIVWIVASFSLFSFTCLINFESGTYFISAKFEYYHSILVACKVFLSIVLTETLILNLLAAAYSTVCGILPLVRETWIVSPISSVPNLLYLRWYSPPYRFLMPCRSSSSEIKPGGLPSFLLILRMVSFSII